MTGNEVGDGIAADRRAGRARRVGMADCPGELAVTHHRAGGNLQQRLPDPRLKNAAADIRAQRLLALRGPLEDLRGDLRGAAIVALQSRARPLVLDRGERDGFIRFKK